MGFFIRRGSEGRAVYYTVDLPDQGEASGERACAAVSAVYAQFGPPGRGLEYSVVDDDGRKVVVARREICGAIPPLRLLSFG